MPFSSMNFTSEASLKRGGGCVSCPSARASRSSGAVALGERGEAHLRVVALALVLRRVLRPGVGDLPVEAQEPGVPEHRAGRAQDGEVGRAVPPRLDLDRRHVAHRRRHLRGHEAVPDQPVELQLVRLHVAGDGLGRKLQRGGPYGLVRVLDVLLLLVAPRLRGQARLPVGRADVLAHRDERLVGDADGVGPHVGDEADRAELADRLALVEPLGEGHGLADREADRAGRRLLQLRGGEGRGRVLAPLAGLDRRDAQGGGVDVRLHLLGGLARREARVGAVELQLLAPPDHHARGEGGGVLRERHRDREVRHGHEAPRARSRAPR